MATNIPVHAIDDFIAAHKKEIFYANTLQNHISKHHFIQEPHKHNFYLCVLFTKGKGTHTIDFIDYTIKTGSIFFLNPGQMHSWKLSIDIDGFIFFHTKDFYDLNFDNRKIQDFPFFNSIYTTPLIQTNAVSLNKMTFLFEEILITHKTSDHSFKNAKLCSLIDLVYIDATQHYSSKKDTQETKQGYLLKLRKLEKLIDTHFKEIKSATVYASMMNITRKHLNRICKSCMNKSVSDLITDRVILEAKRMLMHPEFSIAQIADELGYFDHSYFNKLFKKKIGKTPSMFIQQHYK